ncbi:ABC transporter permease [Sinorhizobium terangae]|uniref:ABC transporter permease n=1 Tax=Sinorhizobium terangae TaxID=110322 RepID=UPI0024B1D620|nr:ABC transporter permease [Sinorhizobium terangae]WFU51747.1 ABC transporter permease [Sinorhizobium terangae]
MARNRPVAEILAPRLLNTFLLVGFSALIAIPISFGFGIAAAVKRDSFFDIASSALIIMAMAIPEFVIATILILIFSIFLRILPAVSIISGNDTVIQILANAALPIGVLSIVMIAHIMRVMRTSMIDILDSDFIKVGTFRGLSFSRLVFRHALPSALPPALNVTAMSLASLLGGVVVIERVFNYPGLGTLTLQAIHDRDMPVVQATVIIFTATYVGLGMLADFASSLADPSLRRIRV